jgi:7,8-dihydropterin-6-yl-methyl-4-(beta-D-ribofuranosyl)aminobenzene 5'-phosphate synthase
MRIVTLIENLTYKQGLVAEHGLSLYLETDNKKILFDTGQSGLFLQNAEKLGIHIEDIDSLVISHGHYDHTGGLYPFLQKNTKAKIYAKNEIFIPKYHGQNRFIGIERNETLLKDRFIPIDSVTEIVENLFIMPDIPIQNPVDTHFRGLTIKRENEWITDEFTDELFLVIKQNNQINIITACSHRGITNICQTATDYFKFPVNLILGGFHMKESTTNQYVEITYYLRLLQPQRIGVCHCTGIDKYAELRNDCDTNVFYNFTGTEITI